MNTISRRRLLIAASLCACGHVSGPEARSQASLLAAAARRQLSVTRDYDPVYRRIAYPNGDVPLATGVCADVVVRAARDALGLDLQRLVHEDMVRDFAAYPSRRTWGLTAPDSNIDHRRVLNLETFWSRSGAELGRAKGGAGFAFPTALEAGDILTWRLWDRLPHVAVVVDAGAAPRIVHNIGGGAQEAGLWSMAIHRPVGHYRWPA